VNASLLAIPTAQKSAVDLAQYGDTADVEKDLLLEKVLDFFVY
jgi:hypothetical protein